ncbi:AI-2E family transporter [Thioalkalivibrio denitrificans]|uniref:AI-2E family transporter n=1 Tax=Thioalkalivibrio denitrificans TaxID=108003 RepID=A0A1V3NFC5_9GAMM|nr:AI-2E family transporter [Thioalkalivibrio denitrificans]OOG23578.1 AI-2E family transporter [Thioalkalivibrio denitrificans]
MIGPLRDWYNRHFTDPQVVILALLLIFGTAIVVLAGRLLAPLLASVILAYVLEGAVQKLQRLNMPRLPAVILVFVVFLALFVVTLLGLFPLLSQQIVQLVRELPGVVAQGQNLLLQLPERYPQFVSEEQVREMMGAIRTEATLLGQRVVSLSLASAMHLVTFFVYLIIVPLMVFFLLKDKDAILHWITSFLPRDRGLASEVWAEVNVKIASYVRGKFVEILIVWAVTFVTFTLFGLNYAMLLSVMVGVSVIIPYIGAAVVTIPVALVAYFQWGLSAEFAWVLIAYAIIQFLDGNVLVPLLFSEVVNLHPVAIIAAVIVFGGLWGLWGVFFAIPLATLIQAVIRSWPRYREVPVEESKRV